MSKTEEEKKRTFHQKWQISIQNMIHSFISNLIQRIIQYNFFQEYLIQKKYSIIFFPGKFNSKIDSKILIWLDSIQ